MGSLVISRFLQIVLQSAVHEPLVLFYVLSHFSILFRSPSLSRKKVIQDWFGLPLVHQCQMGMTHVLKWPCVGLVSCSVHMSIEWKPHPFRSPSPSRSNSGNRAFMYSIEIEIQRLMYSCHSKQVALILVQVQTF